ncbi:right-handed parallel beta-helix repeat-containing protein [Bacillus spongiae]|uniref:Right-handed parallel beta-helix repeat-containing protein n=1 Tax=Bacillus spongiae TaxID=2683610 RepID=A0ABU8HAU1_9BACI
MTLRIVPTDDFPTVQAAIDDSAPGDSIKLLVGTFDGFEVTVENLKIFGCGIGRTIISGQPAQGNIGVVVKANRTVLQGFTVQGFLDSGVLIEFTYENNVVKEIESRFNTLRGLIILGVNNLILNCKVANNADVGILASRNNCIMNCKMTNNDRGFNGGINNILIHNLFKESGLTGCFLGNNSIAFRNTFLNGLRGLDVNSNNMIIENMSCRNSETGILISSDDNVIDSNLTRNNNLSGINVMEFATNNTIRFNKAFNNSLFDIQATPPANENNTFNGNKCGNSFPPELCT